MLAVIIEFIKFWNVCGEEIIIGMFVKIEYKLLSLGLLVLFNFRQCNLFVKILI